MMDCVFINQLHLLANIGVHPHEKQAAQSLWLDIELFGDFDQAAASDDLHATVDYAEVVERVSQRVAERHYQLLEHLGEVLAKDLFGHYPLIQRLSLRLTKPAVVAGAKSVGVLVNRERPTH